MQAWSGMLRRKGFYSVNRYKPLQNRLLRKPLQTVTNRYKPLQTSYSANRYEPLQTIYLINRHEPLHYQSDTMV